MIPADVQFEMEPWRSELPSSQTGPLWNPGPSDALWQFYPRASYAQEAWRERLPLWDPYSLCGLPALAQGREFSNPLFAVLCQVLSLDTTLRLMVVLTLVMASVGSFLFLRELNLGRFGALLGSAAYSYNTYLTGFLPLTEFCVSMVWFPLILWACERAVRRHDLRWALVGAVGFALQIMSGTILWPFYAGITLALLIVARAVVVLAAERSLAEAVRPLIAGGIVLGLGAMLAAPQLLLTLELFSLTPRGEPIGLISIIPIKHLARLVAPDFWGNPLHGNRYWGSFNHIETNLYWGIVPLLCVGASLLSRRRAQAAIVFGLGLLTLLAVVGVPPFRSIVSAIYPVFLNTFPGRIFYVTSLVWAIAAAIGADWLYRERPVRVIWLLVALAAAAAGCLLALAGTLQLERANIVAILGETGFGLRMGSLLRASVLLSASAVLLSLWARRENRWALRALLVLAGLDLFTLGMRYNETVPPQQVLPTTPSLERLQQLVTTEPEPVRVATVPSGAILYGASPQFFRLQTVPGYNSWMLSRTWDYLNLTGVLAETPFVMAYLGDCCNPLLDALNVKYLYVAGDFSPVGASTLDLVGYLPRARIQEGQPAAVQSVSWTIGGVTRRAILQQPPSRITFPVQVDRPARFDAMVAMSPEAWDKPGDGMGFEVVLERSGREPETLFSRYIDPKRDPAQRVWHHVVVDLQAVADEEPLTLTLVTSAGPRGDATCDWGGWGYPRIMSESPPALELVFDGENRIYRNNRSLPRAWIVHRVREVDLGDTARVKDELRRPDFNPRELAIVEGRLRRSLDHVDTADAARITDYRAESVTVETRSEGSGLLVLSDVFYPGWEVTVDGVPTQVFPTNLMMRAVFLEPGTHRVVFEFDPPNLARGILGSLTAMAFVVGVWAWETKKRARQRHRATA